MPLYFGKKSVKMIFGGKPCNFRFAFNSDFTNNIRLLSKNGLFLQDSNGLYLATIGNPRLLSFDNYILKDKTELYLTVKESE